MSVDTRGVRRPETGARAQRAYLKDPDEIYAASFAAIRAEADLAALPQNIEPVAVRLIHACGMTDIVRDLRFSPDVMAGRDALASGAPVFVDCTAVQSMVMTRLLPGTEIICTLNDPRVSELATSLGTTRSAAAVELWRDRLDGAVVVIGNAPTALFHLLEMLDGGGPRPAAILGVPVGFVGAAEAKAALAENDHAVPYLTLLGRRGGSAIAAAALNAIAGGLSA